MKFKIFFYGLKREKLKFPIEVISSDEKSYNISIKLVYISNNIYQIF